MTSSSYWVYLRFAAAEIVEKIWLTGLAFRCVPEIDLFNLSKAELREIEPD